MDEEFGSEVQAGDGVGMGKLIGRIRVKHLFVAVTVVALAGMTDLGHAEGDAAKGQRAFAKCAACHRVGPAAKNGVGPVLNGIIGRKAGTYEGYQYSPANMKSGVVWDESHLTIYLKAPAKTIPGTKMLFPGIPNEREIADLIAYLKSFKDDGSRIGD